MVTTQRLNRCALAVAMLFAAATPAFADAKSDADLAYLPLDAEFVGGLDYQALQNSAIYKNGIGQMIAKQGMPKELVEFQQLCGIDPQKAVNRISFGLKLNASSGAPEGVVLLHGVQKAKAIACYDKIIKEKKLGGNTSRAGDVLLFSVKGTSAAVTFTSNDTALVVIGPGGTKDGIKNIAKGGGSLKSSAVFAELYKKTNTGDTLWVIANGGSKAFDSMASLGIKPRAVFGSVGVTKDLNLDVRFRMKSPTDAASLQTMLNQQAKPAQGMVDKLAISTDASDVRVVLGLSEAKLKAIAGMMGAGMGGGKP